MRKYNTTLCVLKFRKLLPRSAVKRLRRRLQRYAPPSVFAPDQGHSAQPPGGQLFGIDRSEKNMLQELSDYLNGSFNQVEGWCDRHVWFPIAACHTAQKKRGASGPVAEIGVYHGKFFIGLAKLNGSAQPHYAIDVFDQQEFNLDYAGAGNLKQLHDNMGKCGFKTTEYKTYATDSMRLSPEEIARIKAETGGFAMFSVDGCHRVEHTINDIRVAMALTIPTGIIFVDDYYNADWPGVQEGVMKLYFNESPRFVPLLYSSNKLFLCHISYHDYFLSEVCKYLKQHYPEFNLKLVPRFGYQTVTVTPHYTSPPQIVLS